MSKPPIVLRENPLVRPRGSPEQSFQGDIYRVVIIDNDHNTYQEVIEICMTALNVDFEHAYKIALAVDHNGEADVFHGPRADAERIAEIIRTIGIEVRVLSTDG